MKTIATRTDRPSLAEQHSGRKAQHAQQREKDLAIKRAAYERKLAWR